MNKEINFFLLFKVLKNAWWKILIFTVIIAVATAAISEFVIPKKYSSTTEFYVLNTSTTSEYTTTALLSAAEYLANDYIAIIHGDRMIETILADIAQKGYTTYSPNKIRSMIGASTSSDSSTFSITVTSTDRDLAFYICDSIKDKSPEIIKEVTRPSYTSSLYRKSLDEFGNDIYTQINKDDLECIEVNRAPELAKTHVSPNVLFNTIIAAFLSAGLAYIFFLIRKIADTIIRNEDSARDLIDETIIGDIPNWTVHAPQKSVSEESHEEK